ncbi:MAG: hypothetical protein IID46_03395, partial [Planctomycetes bacterium]|nr:hypothetical protein [Planctomycetota bacterium]
KEPFGFVKLLFLSRNAKGRLVGNTLIFALVDRGIAYAFEAEDQSTTRLQLSKLAYALAGYRAKYGSYPQKLSQLAPRYIPKVPTDLFSGRSFRYEADLEDFLLYSVGPNGKDDGGRNNYSEPSGDDLVIDTRPKVGNERDDL